jgi:hypothetical protein
VADTTRGRARERESEGCTQRESERERERERERGIDELCGSVSRFNRGEYL